MSFAELPSRHRNPRIGIAAVIIALVVVLFFSRTICSWVIDYSDYREVAGVKIPFQWRLTWTGGQSMFSLDEVRPNVAIDPAKFAKPVAAPKPVVAPAKVTQ